VGYGSDGPKHKVAALQPAAREQEPIGQQLNEDRDSGVKVSTINKRCVGVQQMIARILMRPAASSAAPITQ
jgi:hypothetical protein